MHEKQDTLHPQPRKRLWFPAMHNVVACYNRNYLHSLWLATMVVIIHVPVMVVMQWALPIYQILLAAILGIYNIVASVIRGLFWVSAELILRIFRSFWYGVFGYLDTASDEELRQANVLIMPPTHGDDEMRRGTDAIKQHRERQNDAPD